MFVVYSENEAFPMLIGTMLMCGSWTSVRTLCKADAPVFAILFVLGQVIFTMFIAFTLGNVTDVNNSNFTNDYFFDEVSHTNLFSHRSLAIFAGGFLLANADFFCACACTRVPFSVAYPIYAGLALAAGCLISYAIQGTDAHLGLFVFGIICAICAIICIALSEACSTQEKSLPQVLIKHSPDAKHRPMIDKELLMAKLKHGLEHALDFSAHNKQLNDSVHSTMSMLDSHEPLQILNVEKDVVLSQWVFIAALGGLLAGTWSPLSSYGRHDEQEDSGIGPFVCMFIFQCGQLMALPLMLWYYGHIMIVKETNCSPVSITNYLTDLYQLPIEDKGYGLLTGCMIGFAYVCYFTASEVIPPTLAFAIGSCCPLVTILIGVFIFKNLHEANFAQRVLVAASFSLFVLAITVMVFSDTDEGRSLPKQIF